MFNLCNLCIAISKVLKTFLYNGFVKPVAYVDILQALILYLFFSAKLTSKQEPLNQLLLWPATNIVAVCLTPACLI